MPAEIERRRLRDGVRVKLRSIFGGLPKSTCSGRSIGFLRCRRCSVERAGSRSAYADDGERAALALADVRQTPPCSPAQSRARSAPAPRCTRPPAGSGRPRPRGMACRSKRPPQPPSLTSSGNALDRPPAPTSWMNAIGLSSPRCQQRSMTSCARRSISALSRCTLAKSSSALPVPALLEAAPPPRPISIAGPPRHDQRVAGIHRALLDVLGADVAEAAGEHDGLVIAEGRAAARSVQRCGSSRRDWGGRTRC